MPPSLEALRRQVRAADHDERQLAFLRGEAARLATLCDERRRRLSCETRDVEDLEGFSLSGLLMQWLGTKEALLVCERREEVEARLHFRQASDELHAVEARIGRLAAAAPARERARRELAEARERLRSELVARGGRVARRVEELADRLEEHERRRFELAEARAVCSEARAELARVVEALDEAYSHGAADLFAWGYHANRSAAEGKREGLNRAHDHVTCAADALRRLRGELADTGLRAELELALPGKSSVADLWLDSLLTDWLTQRSLSRSRARAEEAHTAVAALERRLVQAESAAEAEEARDRRLLDERLQE